MTITIEYFGQLFTVTGTKTETRDVQDGTTVKQLLLDRAAHYGDAFVAITQEDQNTLRSSLLVTVNEDMTNNRNEHTLKDNDVVRLLPAIAGG